MAAPMWLKTGYIVGGVLANGRPHVVEDLIHCGMSAS